MSRQVTHDLCGTSLSALPQSNGQTECANQEIEKYLRLYVSRRQEDWAQHLPLAEFTINSRIHSAHDRSPFEVVYGYTPPFNIPIGKTSGIRGVDNRMAKLTEVKADVEAALRIEKAHQKEDFEAGKRKAHSFEVDDFVWLNGKDIKRKVASKKLGDIQLGPYKVLAKIGELDYKLDLPPSMSRIHPVFHVNKLSSWKGNDVNGILPPPPEPVELDDEIEYEVQEILDSRWIKRGRGKPKFEYLVSWRGFLPRDDTWEPEENLKNSQEYVEEFHKRFPEAPTRIKASIFATLPWRPIENFTNTEDLDFDWEEGRRIARVIEDDEE